MIKRVVPFDMLAPFLREQMDDGAMITAIRNAWIVTQDASRRIIRGDVVIDGERIVSVGPAYNGTADREIDATGDIVMPGMINTHTHVAMSVMKGVVDDLLFPDFLAIIQNQNRKRGISGLFLCPGFLFFLIFFLLSCSCLSLYLDYLIW